MISYDDALAIVAAAARPLGRERVALDLAHGRVLAERVAARVDSPASDVSTMDGYAVRATDPSPLRLIGESFPGAGYAGSVGPGECVRIFTGAPLPAGADRVVRQEIVRRDGDMATIEGRQENRFVRKRGADFRARDVLLGTALRLHPRALVAAAAADIDSVIVWRRPRVALIATGDEIAEPGRARPGSLPDSISIAMAAFVDVWGGDVVARHRVRDDPDAIAAAASEAIAACDLVVVTGGASVGEKDHAKRVFGGLGLETMFANVAIKPGKPVWFGRAGDALVLGLPGNPTSALVTARLLLAPLVFGLTGRDPGDATMWRTARAALPIPATGDRETFLRSRWNEGVAEPMVNQDSGAQRALADAELLIRRRAGDLECAAGESVDILDF